MDKKERKQWVIVTESSGVWKTTRAQEKCCQGCSFPCLHSSNPCEIHLRWISSELARASMNSKAFIWVAVWGGGNKSNLKKVEGWGSGLRVERHLPLSSKREKMLVTEGLLLKVLAMRKYPISVGSRWSAKISVLILLLYLRQSWRWAHRTVKDPLVPKSKNTKSSPLC